MHTFSLVKNTARINHEFTRIEVFKIRRKTPRLGKLAEAFDSFEDVLNELFGSEQVFRAMYSANY